MQMIKDRFDYSVQNQVGLNNEGKALFIYNRFITNNESILFVCNSLYDANNMYQTILNYTKDCLLFPMDDFLTSEALAISPELKITRIETLNKIITKQKKIVVTNLMGYLRFLPNTNVYQKSILTYKIGDEIEIDELISKLNTLGYERQTIVNKTGEYAPRGFVLDLFPISYEYPVRLEFWGNEIAEIKKFNVDTQMTIGKEEQIVIYPNTEFLMEKVDENILESDKKQYLLPKYTNIQNIYDFLEKADIIYNNLDEIIHGVDILLKEENDYKKNIDNPPDKYMFSFEDIKVSKYYNFKILSYKKDDKEYDCSNIEVFSKNPKEISNNLERYIKKNIVTICLHNKYSQNKIIDYMPDLPFIFTDENKLYPNKVNLIIKKINSSFRFDEYIFISENDIFNVNSNYKYQTNFKIGSQIRDITKLNNGDFIVHQVYGIGKYIGIKTLEKNGIKKDYLAVEYAGGDKLYIPASKIEYIYKYASSDANIQKLSKLGTNEWKKTKLKVRAKVEEMAHDLLELYAKREAARGFKFKKDDETQTMFEQEFEYVMTPDQEKATYEIKQDMEKEQPMDRLLCGDVGFGKTEVAFRAIFKAIMSNKQAAILCPTTILSSQHYQNAIERFKKFPVTIALLNRFVTTKRKNEILADLKDGKIDLLIGTHKILGKNIEFKDLGLLVIDEEQRFGVAHKEKIKKYKESIDVLTLSATPIPRTLQMSLSGIRGLSLIETPPAQRYPIQTYVLEENKSIIKDAVYKELSRNGQVFIMYNRIEEMENKKIELEQIIPDAKIVCIHGRMDKDQIEDVMMKFINKEYDILLCTTIIETGIDIPSVNTLIIYDADKYGLSQLYQIRGRVGRSNKIAYCYLMYNKDKILSDVATKRLEAIKDFTELGSGLSIAMRDLSIRGAGDILGSEQAGFVASVGMELFMDMLHEEVEKLNGHKEDKDNKEETNDVQPLLDIDTNISDNYVSDENLKIEIHKKINSINSMNKLLKIRQELNDRFGEIPDNIIIYMYEELFEVMARRLDINKLKQNRNFIEFELPEEISILINYNDLFIDSQKITKNIRFKLDGLKLIIILDINNLDKHYIYYLLEIIELIYIKIDKKV